MTNDLIGFLRARLDEDEAAARAAREGPWAIRQHAGSDEVYSVAREERIGGDSNVFPDAWHRESAEHAVRHDPARVLRETQAKRRLLDEIQRACRYGAARATVYCPTNAECACFWCIAVRTLALPYAEHPDYRPEWAA